jgi:hypothetical protein
MHLPADDIGESERAAAIRHVHHVDAGHRLEQFSGEVTDRTDALRSQVDLSRVRLGIGDELGNGLRWKRRIDHHHIARAKQRGDRSNIANDSVGQVAVEAIVDRVRYRDEEQRVAVGRRSNRLGRADVSAAARSAIHDEGLPEPLREPLRD